MRVSLARVRFSRQANDGNYGSETISVEREVVGDEDDDEVDSEVVTATLHRCRLEVEEELRRSPNWSVQRAAEYPKPEPPKEIPTGEDLEEMPF